MDNVGVDEIAKWNVEVKRTFFILFYHYFLLLFAFLHLCTTALLCVRLDQELLRVCEKGNLNRSDDSRQHLRPATPFTLG